MGLLHHDKNKVSEPVAVDGTGNAQALDGGPTSHLDAVKARKAQIEADEKLNKEEKKEAKKEAKEERKEAERELKEAKKEEKAAKKI